MKNNIILGVLFFLIFSCKNNSNIKIENKTEKTINNKIVDSLIFKVDEVPLAKELLVENESQKVFETKIGNKIVYFPEEHQNEKFVFDANNIFLQTIQTCYDSHRPLILSPDIIWLAIMQGVSIHVNQKFDSLNSVLFIKNKPKQIEIWNDKLAKDVREWKNLVSSLAIETQKYTNSDNYNFVVADFSTTSEIEKLAYQITLLESYKQAFEYIGESGCGIPEIKLRGSKKDWEQIYSKLDDLDKFGLQSWKNELKPIVQQFINVYDNKIEKLFWKDIYKNATEYGGFYISGWVIKFFPYIVQKDYESEKTINETEGLIQVNKIFKPNPYLIGNQYHLSTLSTDNFPSGIAIIDVLWKNRYIGKDEKYNVNAGFFAIKQYRDKFLMPLISWSVSKDKITVPNHELIETNDDEEVEHKSVNWSPKIYKDLVQEAIYDIKTFKTHKKSLQYIKTLLQDSVSNNMQFQVFKNNKINISFIVLSNGQIADFKLIDIDNIELKIYLENKLNSLPKEWFPALADAKKIVDIELAVEKVSVIEGIENAEEVKIRVNSEVKMELW